jgi:type VI secretion system protein ImpK
MTDQDPFAAFESDRTVIKPSAGRARPAQPAQPVQGTVGGAPGYAATPAAAGNSREQTLALDALMTANMNPLVSAAMPLLATAPRIRHMVQHPNPPALKDALSASLQKFESQARAQGLPNEQVIAARYILCTLLDESAASTPWGGGGTWAAQSLLVQFHNETWGGEKVFQLMSKLAENVPANRNLLELLYVTLALGFEGRYRVIDNGKAQLDSLRQRLAEMLQQGQPAPERALALNWRGVGGPKAGLAKSLPLWVFASVFALVLMLGYAAFRLGINSTSDAAFAALRGLDVKVAELKAEAPPPEPAPPRLEALLRPEIEAGLIRVLDLHDRSVITIKGDGFFAPGSADVARRVKPLLVRIDDALAAFPGAVLITGHTDNLPIRTLLYPSNWHLSQDRATAVGAMLGKVKAERIRTEGRADAEPVADNATAEGRALNRRVEITLFAQ